MINLDFLENYNHTTNFELHCTPEDANQHTK